MAIRICPQCNKAFYTAVYEAGSDFCACYYCKYYLLNRRIQGRKKTSADFNFMLQKTRRSATVTDYSSHGARIAYTAQSLPVHTVIDVKVHELKIQRSAKTLWTRRVGRMVETGLKFL